MRTAVLWGALSATAQAFPLAALCALLYRFPIPFGGYASGPGAVPLALVAVARLALAFGATASLLGVLLLAVLDKLIGTW